MLTLQFLITHLGADAGEQRTYENESAAKELVRRRIAVVVKDAVLEPSKVEPPGGEVPPLLLARLRREGKLPMEETQEPAPRPQQRQSNSRSR